ncbi:MAG: PQQ-dependent sugar dehydrogenase [Phycisphaerales bacterium]
MQKLVGFIMFGLTAASAFGQTLPDYVQLLPLPVPGDAWVWAGSPPGDTARLFVMEGGGTIRVLDITKQPGQLPTYTLRTAPFLVNASPQARSVAFAPDFATSGRFYVAAEVTGPTGTAIKEFTVSAADPNIANATPTRTIKTFTGLTFDHAVGSMYFGRDGMLYVGVGDGMSSSNGQAINTPLGKMLRIDVLSGQDDFPADTANNYHVPADNPLVGRSNAVPEIWHIGIRNPWRWSFDRWSGDMWICDVGGNRAGEVDRLVGSGTPYSNLGWPVFDGTQQYSGNLNPDFTIPSLVVPLVSINRETSQCSTIGGVMYRGNELRPWRGRFVWSDACGGDVYSAAFDGTALGPVQSHRDQLRNVTTGGTVSLTNVSMIAEDGSGELYVLQASRGGSSGGIIHRFVGVGDQPALADVGQAGGIVGVDGLLDNNDFIAFITLFFNNDPRADMGAQGGVQGVDQRLDNNDFIAFINAFFDGI